MKPNRLFPVPVFAALALALTLSCSSDGGGGGEEPAKLSSSSLWAAVSSSSVWVSPPGSSSFGASSSSETFVSSSSAESGSLGSSSSGVSSSSETQASSSSAVLNPPSSSSLFTQPSSSSFAPPVLIPNPDPPAGVTAMANSTNSISIGWGTVSGATGYYIYRSTTMVGPYERIGSSTSTSYTDGGLSSGATYYYRVSGYNSGGESDQSSEAFATTWPGTPIGLVATASSSVNSITVSWEEVSGATGYRIYRNTTSSGTFTQVGTSGSASYTDAGLGAVTTYYYKVTAYNSGGEGTQSSYVSAKTLLSACGGELYSAADANMRCNSNVLETKCGTSNWYSQSTQFCSGSSVYSKCGGRDYNPSTEFCSNGTIKSYGTFTDTRDNKTYKTTVIGTQTWMAENLNYAAEGSKCYDNNPSSCTTYGRLYNWSTAHGVCPSGWHLPSDAEWNTLMKVVNPSCTDNADCALAGTKLKATSWNGGGNGTDDYGFAALPGGYGSSGGYFGDVGDVGSWWSASEGSSDLAYRRQMSTLGESAYRLSTYKDGLFSVRCLQDCE
ncbi:hypothetical protein R83H12_02461 [Fibrobacteria bacterium R8-3-H12]